MACNINCSYGIIRSVIKKMNLTYKKPKFINCPNKINIKSKTDLFIDKFKKLYNYDCIYRRSWVFFKN